MADLKEKRSASYWKCKEKARKTDGEHYKKKKILKIKIYSFWFMMCYLRDHHLFTNTKTILRGMFKNNVDFHCSVNMFWYVTMNFIWQQFAIFHLLTKKIICI